MLVLSRILPLLANVDTIFWNIDWNDLPEICTFFGLRNQRLPSIMQNENIKRRISTNTMKSEKYHVDKKSFNLI